MAQDNAEINLIDLVVYYKGVEVSGSEVKRCLDLADRLPPKLAFLLGYHTGHDDGLRLLRD